MYNGARIINKRTSDVPHTKRSVIAILSTSDTIPYFITMMSILRADKIFFPISPRNSAAAVAHLLRKVEVDHILIGHDSAMETLVTDALKILRASSADAEVKIPLLSLMLTFEDLFLPVQDQAESDLPLVHTDPDEIVLYLHSSGSTAFPKPIPWTNHRLIQLSHIPWFGGQDLTDQVWSLHVMPMYHGMGVLQLCWAASCGLVVAGFTPKNPAVLATPTNLFDSAKATNSDLIFCVPSFIEYDLKAWSKEPEYMEWLSTRTGVLYGGGPLNKEAGDLLTSKGVSIYILYGSTEGGIMSPIIPARGSMGYDWDYFTFPGLVTPEMVPYGNGSYEFVMVANVVCKPSVINTTVNGIPAYATSDLMTPHPTKKGYWRVFGRTDDQIMHNTGEKTNPGPLENLMNQDPHVQASVMFGRGQFHAGIIVEPKQHFTFDVLNEKELSKFPVDRPTIERMNEFAPQHSRLFKEMILVANPAKPFTYTAKNTARRQAILDDYAQEINEMYRTVEESTQSSIPAPQEWSIGSAQEFVRVVVQKVLQKNISDQDDFFEHGCDSLQATWIRNSLLRALRDSAKVDSRNWTTKNFVYDYPNIDSLSDFISSLATGMLSDHKDLDGEGMTQTEISEKKAAMLLMLDEFSQNFPQVAQVQTKKKTHDSNKKVVLVTGTTGALGSHLLSRLLDDFDIDGGVSCVYALNRGGKGSRSPSLLERQMLVFKKRGLESERLKREISSGRMVLLEADFTMERLGLDLDMAESVTHIVHNAWQVDFNASFATFGSNLLGLRNLVDLALTSDAHFLYTSSIGVFQNIKGMHHLTPDLVNPEVAIGTGYSESKWVSEQLIARAAPKLLDKSESKATYKIVRVGQLCGDTKLGAWNHKEWVPTMIQSAVELGCLPNDDKAVSWIPVNVAARVIVGDLLTSYEQSGFNESDFKANGATIVHLAHPNPVSWSELAPVLIEEMGRRVDLVSYGDWLAKLQEHGSDLESDGRLPAVQLLPFYTSLRSRDAETELESKDNREAFGMPKMAIGSEDSPDSSKKYLSSVEPLSKDDAVRWIKYWKKIGWIDCEV
ncbi:hypothetical protein D9758_003563 [Tetrapyrgos nigripes]|uniref:Polyketide synthase-like phosphopantetheine-binding domain-containing protein n=1 Tax=Tetrapyrgos nigripes TaxID=182062 RepID=A0A8H5GUP5_9AGAR|nr:hypothetical protein D9758_003563 [Tetrapyrgos nigripes]